MISYNENFKQIIFMFLSIYKNKSILKFIGFIIILGIWVIFLFKQITQLDAYDWTFSGTGFFGSIFLSAFYSINLALGWAILLRDMAQKKNKIIFSVVKAIRAWLLTIMSRYLPGKVWHIFSRMAFDDNLKVSRLQILSSSTIEQILAVFGAMLIAAISIPFWPLSAIPKEWFSKSILLAIFLLLGLIFLHPRILGSILRWGSAKLSKPELNWQFKYATITRLVLLYALAAFTAGLALTMVMVGLEEFRLTDMIFIIGSSALAWVVGYMSFITPSGLGVREGVLTALLALSYPLPVAIVASLLFRVVCTLGEFMAIVFFLMWMRLFAENRN